MGNYVPEIGVKICAELAEGKSLVEVCKTKGFPSRATVYRWLRESEEFRTIMSLAHDDQADAIADDVLKIADSAGKTKAAINKARLQIDARKWYAAKVRPKKYGDRITQEHTGEGGGPLVVEVVRFGTNPDSE
jgi:hypothetical protein